MNAFLNDIAHLKSNWNGNNANPFPASLIEKCTIKDFVLYQNKR